MHKTHLTPHVASGVMALASFAIAAISTVAMGGFNAFLFTGVVGTLGSILVHIMANASLPKILKDKKLKVGYLNMVITVVAIGFLGFIFYGSFISISSPVLIAAYSFVIWMVIGLVYIEYKNRNRGEAEPTLATSGVEE